MMWPLTTVASSTQRAPIEVDRFLDVLHHLVQAVALCMAAFEFRNEGEVAVLVVFDNDL